MPEKRKKILAVLSRVPWPLEKGDKLRSYHLLRELGQNHDVFLFCLSDKPVHPDTESKLREWCKEIYIHRLKWPGLMWRLAKAFFSNKMPFQVEYFYSPKAQKEFDRFLEAHIPDVLFCQLIRTTEYVRKYTMFPKILDYMDALSAGMKRTAAKASWPFKPFMHLEAGLLSNYECSIYNQFNTHLVISEQDASAIRGNTNMEMLVVENGVEERFFEGGTGSKTIDVLFTGNMSYRPNVESAQFMVNDIMPLVWKEFPGAKVTLAGANPSSRIMALQGKNVRVTGWVDDLKAYYSASRVFCAPMLINSGLQNKLLEAMANGIPSITTSLANNALGAKHETNIIVADTAHEIARSIIALLKDEPLRMAIGSAGKEFIRKNYSWKKAGRKLQASVLKLTPAPAHYQEI